MHEEIVILVVRVKDIGEKHMLKIMHILSYSGIKILRCRNIILSLCQMNFSLDCMVDFCCKIVRYVFVFYIKRYIIVT